MVNLSRNRQGVKSLIRVEVLKHTQDRVVGKILRTLPEYFGFESAIVDYCDCARRSGYTTYAAIAEDSSKIGFAMLVMNNEMTAQIWCMAVLKDFHRHGIGGLLLEQVEQGARERGRQYIMAKTIGPSQNDPNYLKTFAFYCKNDYTMVAEISDHVWGGSYCAVLVKKL